MRNEYQIVIDQDQDQEFVYPWALLRASEKKCLLFIQVSIPEALVDSNQHSSSLNRSCLQYISQPSLRHKQSSKNSIKQHLLYLRIFFQIPNRIFPFFTNSIQYSQSQKLKSNSSRRYEIQNGALLTWVIRTTSMQGWEVLLVTLGDSSISLTTPHSDDDWVLPCW